MTNYIYIYVFLLEDLDIISLKISLKAESGTNKGLISKIHKEHTAWYQKATQSENRQKT